MAYRPGPGWAVAAAFLGPGTVTTALVAGAVFGPALLWAVPLSGLVTYILQEAAGRLTLAGDRTLGQALRGIAPGAGVRRGLAGLVLVAVVAGTAAFQVGNLLGAALALEALAGVPGWWTAVVVADVAFLLLWFGGAGRVQQVLGGLVALMGVAFVANLALLPVDWAGVAAGLVPGIPDGGTVIAIALVGTTVVPYNLFLHGSLTRDHGWGSGDLGAMRWDLALSVAVGTLLTGALVVSASAVLSSRPDTAAAMAGSLSPLLGPWAGALFALGLLAAAFTSSVTAPLAAAYAAAHVVGFDDGRTDGTFRGVWIGVLVVGAGLAAVGLEPVTAIVAAQAANGLLLPVVAVALLVAVNRGALMGDRVNDRWQNLAGVAATVVAGLLGFHLVVSVLL